MGAKKKNGGGNVNKENQDTTTTTVVLKVDMHCDGCVSKIIRQLRSFQGVETVKAESDAGKVTVTGKVDPTKVRDNLAEKIRKKVELVSPQPKKEKENEKGNKDTKPNNKSENKTQDKKTKDKEVVTTAVLKMALDCQGCLDRIGKTVLKTKGVQEMAVDKEKETVTVTGTMDDKALAEYLAEKLKRKVQVVPPKKDKNGDNKEGGGEKEGSGKKKNKGGGGDKNENIEGGEIIEHNRMEYWAPPGYFYGYGYGYGHGHVHSNIGGHSYMPMYPEQMHFHLHTPPPPQMFSDENPNACSVM